ICAAADHLASLVGIADQLGDPPFCLVHRHLALAFSIVMFGSLGDIVHLHETVGRYVDCSFSLPI
ncbi:hypothetical protein MTR67_026124, partial [Solanum verrucosum]